MSVTQINDLLDSARTLVEAGDYDGAETLRDQARALIENEKLAAEIKRLDMTGVGKSPEPTATEDASIAVKSWAIRRYGDSLSGAEQMSKELYGSSYAQVAYDKYGAMKQWLRTGYADYKTSQLLLLSPEQLVAAAETGMSVAEIKATQIESQSSLGGFTVPEDFRMTVIERLPGMTVVRGLATVVSTNRDVLSMVKRTGGNSRYIGAARVTWTDESPASAATTATNTTFGKVSIPVHVTLANVPISRSLLEDAGIDIVGYIRDELTVAMAIDEDEQFLTGSGIGKPQGILNGTLTGGPFDSDISTSLSGTLAGIGADGIVATPMKIDAQYRSSPSCVWVASKATYGTVYQLQDSQKRYLWRNNIDNLATGYPQNLQGYAIKESEALGTVGTNTFPMIFGDFKRGYTIADRVGMSLERYQDSNTVDKDTVIFYARRRLGGQVTAGWAFAVVKAGTA